MMQGVLYVIDALGTELAILHQRVTDLTEENERLKGLLLASQESVADHPSKDAT